jgi:hypothetical protein
VYYPTKNDTWYGENMNNCNDSYNSGHGYNQGDASIHTGNVTSNVSLNNMAGANFVL